MFWMLDMDTDLMLGLLGFGIGLAWIPFLLSIPPIGNDYAYSVPLYLGSM
jgi:hypothetical protein